MKKKLKFPFILLVSLFAISCSSCDNQKGDPIVEEKFEYSDLYQVEKTKSDPITGKKLYKASFGYIENETQGYNGFYYKDNNGIELTFNNGKFGNEYFINNGAMHSTAENQVMYEFIVPETGKVKLSGNPQLLSESPVSIDIFLNETIIDSKIVSTAEGVYYEHIVDVTKGDKLQFKMMNEGEIYWNPSIDYNYLTEEQILHHVADGYYGDVHPYYDKNNNKMYMYYLSTGMETEEVHERFSSLLYTSTNMIQYTRQKVKMSETNPPDQDLYFALGVYEDAPGNYRSCYGKGNYVGGSLSKDLITWELGSEPYEDSDGLLKYTHRAYFDNGCISGRDPYIYYDKDTEQYYCIVMNYYSPSEANGEKYLTLYTADTDGKYDTPSTKLLPFTGRGDPECPQIMKLNDRRYIFYSVYGTGTSGNVGRFAYRIGDKGVLPQDVDWENKEEKFLDGGDLHAAQLVKVYNTYYLYGWLNYTAYSNVWGGYINLPHEIQVEEDGTLTQRYDPEITKLLNRGEIIDVNNDTIINSTFTSFENDTFSGSGSAELNKDLTRNYLTFSVDELVTNSYAGLSLGLNNLFVGAIDIDGEVYLIVSRDVNSPLADSFIKIDKAEKYDFKVSIDNQFIEVTVNDKAMLSTHTLLNSQYRLKVTSNGNNKISNLQVNKLADYNNIFD